MPDPLTESQLRYARRKLAEYDLRQGYAYKNQLIGLRNDIRRMTGMGIRELRAWLAENDQCGTVIEYGTTKKQCALETGHDGPHVWGEETPKGHA